MNVEVRRRFCSCGSWMEIGFELCDDGSDIYLESGWGGTPFNRLHLVVDGKQTTSILRDIPVSQYTIKVFNIQAEGFVCCMNCNGLRAIRKFKP